MADQRGIKPGQIPEWRRGAIFWKPLADGREVTVYPLLYGAGRLCVGPLGDQWGYDIAYLYERSEEAVEAAKDWDGEASEHPAGFQKIAPGDDHCSSNIPRVGEFAKVHADRDQWSIQKREYPPHGVEVTRRLADGRTCTFAGVERRDVNEHLFCEVQQVSVDSGNLSINNGGETNGPAWSTLGFRQPEAKHPRSIRIPGQKCVREGCGGRLWPATKAEAGIADHTRMMHCDTCNYTYNKEVW